MREPQSKPTIIDEDGEKVVTDNPRGGTGRPANPFGPAGYAGGFGPIPDHLLNKHGKPSLLKLIGWKGAVAIALVVAGVIALAALSFMVLLFALPVLLLLAVIGWIAGKVRRPAAGSSPTAARSVVVIRRRI